MTALEAELGAAYASVLIRLRDAYSFIRGLEQADSFDACLYCKRHISFGHLYSCRYTKMMESIKEFDAPTTAPAGSGMKEEA